MQKQPAKSMQLHMRFIPKLLTQSESHQSLSKAVRVPEKMIYLQAKSHLIKTLVLAVQKPVLQKN